MKKLFVILILFLVILLSGCDTLDNDYFLNIYEDGSGDFTQEFRLTLSDDILETLKLSSSDEEIFGTAEDIKTDAIDYVQKIGFTDCSVSVQDFSTGENYVEAKVTFSFSNIYNAFEEIDNYFNQKDDNDLSSESNDLILNYMSLEKFDLNGNKFIRINYKENFRSELDLINSFYDSFFENGSNMNLYINTPFDKYFTNMQYTEKGYQWDIETGGGMEIIFKEDTNDSIPDDWAIKEIISAVDEGLVTDKVLDNYKTPITREEFCELAIQLYQKATGEELNSPTENPFVDTTNEKIIHAYNLGITGGIGNNKFGPDLEINREQMATMFYRTLQAIKETFVVEDIKESIIGDSPELIMDDIQAISNWALEPMKFMNDKSIITGAGNNLIAPNGTAQRQQAIMISYRLYNYLEPFIQSENDYLVELILSQHSFSLETGERIILNNIDIVTNTLEFYNGEYLTTLPLEDHVYLRADITIEGYNGYINDNCFSLDYGNVDYASSNDKNGIDFTSRNDSIRGYLFFDIPIADLDKELKLIFENESEAWEYTFTLDYEYKEIYDVGDEINIDQKVLMSVNDVILVDQKENMYVVEMFVTPIEEDYIISVDDLLFSKNGELYSFPFDVEGYQSLLDTPINEEGYYYIPLISKSKNYLDNYHIKIKTDYNTYKLKIK